MTNPQKYVGDPNNIVFRSNLERRFFKRIDNDPRFTKFASEEFFIPYISPVDGRVHRYFVDIVVKTIDNKTYVCEIKPSSKCVAPKKTKNKQRYMKEWIEWEVNQAKWKAAQDFCDRKGIKFMLLTEKDLKGYD
jgi:hypothetical protein